MAVATDYNNLVQELYISYFGRPADTLGLANFESQLLALKAPTDIAGLLGVYSTNAGIKSLVDSFGKSGESLALYGAGAGTDSGATLQFVTQIYKNVLNRDPDFAGLTFWTNAILSGNLTVGGAALNIMAGALANTSAQGLLDAKVVQNKVAIATEFTTSIDTGVELAAYVGNTAAASARDMLKTVTSATDPVAFQATVDATIANIVSASIPVTIATLTTGVDTITTGGGNDVFNAILDNGAADQTLTVLDTIDGGLGNNILNIVDLAAAGTALPSGLSVKNVQTVNVKAAGVAAEDFTSGFTGLTNVNVTQSNGNDNVKVGGATALSITDSSGTVTATASTGAVTVNGAGLVTVTGGSTQTVNTAGGVTLSKATGAITVVDTAQGTQASTIDDGTSVTLTTTSKPGAGGTTGTITIGNTTKPSGAISVTENITGVTAGNTAGGLITIKGGTTVSVTENVTQPILTTAGANSTTTQANVAVTGGAATTAVTVNQAAAATAAATVLAVTGSTEVDTLQFTGTLKAGDTFTLAGLTLKAQTDMTAKQVAAAFANLSDAVAVGFTSGAVTGSGSDTVAFTSTGSGNVTNVELVAGAGLVNTSTASTLAVTDTETAGVAAVSAAGKGGVANGTVTIADAGAGTGSGTIAAVTLSNYANSTINSDALTTLTLSGKSGTLGLTNLTQTSLDLNLSGLSGTNTITDSSNHYTTLKVHTSGSSSTLAGFADTAATALTVDGTASLTLTSAAGLTALKTVTVSGSAGLTVGAGTLAGTVTDVNASATSGKVSVTIDATATTFEGGSGNDTVTVSALPTKAISGGTGTDTLVINAAAGTFSNPSINTFVSGFETLGLGANATGTYDATGFQHLTEGGVTAAVTFSNVAAGVDLTMTASPGFNTTYTLKDATGSSDAMTLNMSGATAGGTLSAAGIESVTINANDSSAGTAYSLTLSDSAAKTITVTGNAALTLTSADTAVTTVDASAMTGGLTYTAAGTVAETVKGGAGGNVLTASSGTVGDTLIGGAANDTLVANAGLDTLTGGNGNDTFVIGTASANLNSYATITDASAGDVIQLKEQGTEKFAAAKISLASTAVFQDYANAAINAGGDASANGYIAWFQYNGDTYIVESLHNATATHDFQNGTDVIVKLSGLKDLSTAQLLDTATPLPTIILH